MSAMTASPISQTAADTPGARSAHAHAPEVRREAVSNVFAPAQSCTVKLLWARM